MKTLSKLIVVVLVFVLMLQVAVPAFAAAGEDTMHRQGPGRPHSPTGLSAQTGSMGGFGYRNNPAPLCPTGPGTCSTPICPTGPGTCSTCNRFQQ